MGTDVALPRQSLYVADTEDWQARVERVSLSAQTDVYLNDICAHGMVRLLRTVAEQLFTPGLNGGLRRLMMEGLVMQLLALQVMAADHHSARRPAGLTLRQRAAVQEARERLLADMRNPPSLGALAAAVG